MIKEPRNVDFYTTGKQPSEQDFARISAWIKKNRQQQATRKLKQRATQQKRLVQQ
jgi:hypothetical protein